MQDLIDILCWFINLARGFFELLGIDTGIIDEVTGAIQGIGSKD